MRILKKLATGIVLIAQLAIAGNAVAQAMPATVFEPTSRAGNDGASQAMPATLFDQTPQSGSGWSYDPAKDGMRDLFEMKPIEGCNAPGGLTRITDRDEGDSAPFWCGTPPHCLAENTNGVDACTFVPYCRREPRGDPNGIPGANGCRDPQDLRCVSSGAQPEGGQCLKTCWDGSRILFSSACPPQTVCSTDALGATTCVTIYDTPPTAQPRTPPTPIPGPAPDPLGCSGGSGAYEACFFNWGARAHNQSQTVVSSNGVSGNLSAVCNNGSWNVTSISCDAPTATPTTPTTPSGPAPLPQNCDGGTFTYGTCNFSWSSATHGTPVSVPAISGGTGTLSATCSNGMWINPSASCLPNPPPTTLCPDNSVPVNGECLKTCDDGSRIPQNQACPPPTQTCWDGTVISVYQACPPQTQTCWDGTVISVYQACPPQTKTCPDGTVVSVYQVCPEPTKTCPDGSVIPATAACAEPPPPMQTCWDGTVIPLTAACAPKGCYYDFMRWDMAHGEVAEVSFSVGFGNARWKVQCYDGVVSRIE